MSEPTKSSVAEPAGHTRRGPMPVLFLGVCGLAVLLAIGIVPRVKRGAALAQATKETKESIPQVETVTASLVSQGGLSLPGDIDAIKETTINARTTGYVRKLFVDIGSRVKAGQVVAQIEAPDTDQQTNQAVAQTAQSLAVLNESQADVSRQQASVVQN